jgi:phage terminase small subunit
MAMKGSAVMTELTPKQQRFVEEYLVDLNATQAAIRAGYSEKSATVTASRMLANVSVEAAIAEGKAERSDRTEITQDYVLEVIQDTVERCRQHYPVLDRKGEQVMVETPDGEIVPAFAFDPRSVLKGAELLGKHLGTFPTRVEHSGKDGGPIETKELSDLEFARRMAFALTQGTVHDDSAG